MSSAAGAERRVGPPSGLGERSKAAVLDGLIVILIAWVAVLISAGLPALYPALPLLSVTAYLGVGFASGTTLGMRWAGIALVGARSGVHPSRRTAVARAAVAVISYAGWILTIAFVFSDRPSGGTRTIDLVIGVCAMTIAAAALVGHLWQFVDRDRRSLQDRAFGLAVVSPGPRSRPGDTG